MNTQNKTKKLVYKTPIIAVDGHKIIIDGDQTTQKVNLLFLQDVDDSITDVVAAIRLRPEDLFQLHENIKATVKQFKADNSIQKLEHGAFTDPVE